MKVGLDWILAEDKGGCGVSQSRLKHPIWNRGTQHRRDCSSRCGALRATAYRLTGRRGLLQVIDRGGQKAARSISNIFLGLTFGPAKWTAGVNPQANPAYAIVIPRFLTTRYRILFTSSLLLTNFHNFQQIGRAGHPYRDPRRDHYRVSRFHHRFFHRKGTRG